MEMDEIRKRIEVIRRRQEKRRPIIEAILKRQEEKRRQEKIRNGSNRSVAQFAIGRTIPFKSVDVDSDNSGVHGNKPLTNDGNNDTIKKEDVGNRCDTDDNDVDWKSTANGTHIPFKDGEPQGEVGHTIFDTPYQAAERKKILDGTYPSKIVKGRQRKHIEGTTEFEQNRQAMKRISPGSEPSKLLPNVDAAALIKKYKGTGDIREYRGSSYPREFILTDNIIGQTWVVSKKKYIDTKRFLISYSSIGVHIYPVAEK